MDRVQNQIASLLESAISLSNTLKDAQEATSKSLALQQSDKVDAVRAWDDLYDLLVAFVKTDEAAHQSRLGQALEKTI